MALLRNGHSRVYEYGYFLFNTARDEMVDHQKEVLVNSAFAHRVSGVENEAWKKFVKEHTNITEAKPKKKKQMTKAEHMAVIKRLKGIG